jgi:hypothetical protein
MKISALSVMADVFTGVELRRNLASFTIKSLQPKIRDSNSTNAVTFSSPRITTPSWLVLQQHECPLKACYRSLILITSLANFEKGESYEFGNIS